MCCFAENDAITCGDVVMSFRATSHTQSGRRSARRYSKNFVFRKEIRPDWEFRGVDVIDIAFGGIEWVGVRNLTLGDWLQENVLRDNDLVAKNPDLSRSTRKAQK